ncbi:MAG: ABC transporter permease [Desulfobulbaceae bacterium]|nr:ABC transporter permease [Desulfobulbaceae bacterium]
MLIWTLIKIACKTLLANPLRTFLAMLGIIIGVGAVISMLALGSGAKAQVMGRVTAMGTNLLIVRPGGDRRGGVRSESNRGMKLADAETILRELPQVEAVAPLVMGRAQVKYFNQNINTTITGASLTYLSLRSFEIERGESFSALEDEHVSRVALLGANAAEQLFDEQNPVGETIRIKNVNFKVLGVLKAKGDQGWFNPDDMIIIPITTAMKQISGQDYLSEIDVKVENGADTAALEEKIGSILRTAHRLRPEVEDDFHVRNQSELIEMASSFTRTFSLLLGGIASISLIVGGIGIMNIMLVTVTERTREIGIRKAIGAREWDILRQFLLESIVISGLGGLLGIALGFITTFLVGQFTEFNMLIEGSSIALALVVSAAVGIFFGYYPARRAAKLNPIEALRYE